jgi:hypothetical protein
MHDHALEHISNMAPTPSKMNLMLDSCCAFLLLVCVHSKFASQHLGAQACINMPQKFRASGVSCTAWQNFPCFNLCRE